MKLKGMLWLVVGLNSLVLKVSSVVKKALVQDLLILEKKMVSGRS